jgi:hypothetical protein
MGRTEVGSAGGEGCIFSSRFLWASVRRTGSSSRISRLFSYGSAPVICLGHSLHSLCIIEPRILMLPRHPVAGFFRRLRILRYTSCHRCSTPVRQPFVKRLRFLGKALTTPVGQETARDYRYRSSHSLVRVQLCGKRTLPCLPTCLFDIFTIMSICFLSI